MVSPGSSTAGSWAAKRCRCQARSRAIAVKCCSICRVSASCGTPASAASAASPLPPKRGARQVCNPQALSESLPAPARSARRDARVPFVHLPQASAHECAPVPRPAGARGPGRRGADALRDIDEHRAGVRSARSGLIAEQRRCGHRAPDPCGAAARKRARHRRRRFAAVSSVRVPEVSIDGCESSSRSHGLAIVIERWKLLHPVRR